MNAIVMNQHIHWHCPETRDPFLRAFRAEAAARYERTQAERRRAEYDESKRTPVLGRWHVPVATW